MKTIRQFAITILVIIGCSGFAQNATVRATNFDISDNLDLRAVASIFGDSRNLEDFERRLNDPSLQISNLDLNNDGSVDYLRVIESVEDRVNLIVVQAVLGREMFQDVATVELERNNRNNMVVQIVGNPYFYGNNYIYEPVFHVRPIIYDYFWVHNYRPYCSPWSWGFYPNHFIAWNPIPIYRYRTHINVYVGYNNVCHYSNFRRHDNAARIYEGRRQNYYENSNPKRSFTHRNANVTNRYELSQIRDGRSDTKNLNVVRNDNIVRNSENSSRNYSAIRNSEITRDNSVKTDNSVRSLENTRNNSIRANAPMRSEETTRNNTVRNFETTRDNSERTIVPVRTYETTRDNSVRSSENTRVNSVRTEQVPTRVESSSRRSESVIPRVESSRSSVGNSERTSSRGRRS